MFIYFFTGALKNIFLPFIKIYSISKGTLKNARPDERYGLELKAAA
jgi:hypothetical protein